MSHYQALVDLIKTLAHPFRLRILDILAKEETCVCHLAAALGQRQPYISQQLMILREAGIVRARREGTLIFYRLVDERILRIIEYARQILCSKGIKALPERIPPIPLEGCPCPKCTAARMSFSTNVDTREHPKGEK
ncbi:MAG: helix-turn-helix transcriptional regulator [Anaerolineae bacterium]|nr:helix-turn-helix transcriptional regulator [Anaerolineae bacterium]